MLITKVIRHLRPRWPGPLGGADPQKTKRLCRQVLPHLLRINASSVSRYLLHSNSVVPFPVSYTHLTLPTKA